MSRLLLCTVLALPQAALAGALSTQRCPPTLSTAAYKNCVSNVLDTLLTDAAAEVRDLEDRVAALEAENDLLRSVLWTDGTDVELMAPGTLILDGLRVDIGAARLDVLANDVSFDLDVTFRSPVTFEAGLQCLGDADFTGQVSTPVGSLFEIDRRLSALESRP